MIQPNPVASLVSEGSAKVIRHGCAAGNGRVEHNNAVVGRVSGVRAREGGISKKTCSRAGDKPTTKHRQGLYET